MYRIGKTFEFSASHNLSHLGKSHKCARNHGHNYTITIILQLNHLNDDGMIVDFSKLDSIKLYLEENFDHQNLNEVLGNSKKTTCEYLCFHFYTVFTKELNIPHVISVRVSETPKTFAEYRIFINN